MYTESQVLIFVIISGSFLIVFIFTTVIFLFKLKTKDDMLRKSQKKLKKYSKDLESLVEEKTRDLQKVNEDLRKQIEHRKKLEKELIISERLASIGELAAGLAHKIRNPLTIISSTAQFLNSNKLQRDDIESYSQRIVDSASKANEIIKSLLKFSVYKKGKKLSEDLVPVLNHIIKIVEPTLINQNIKINTDIPSRLTGLQFDSRKLEEVFSNLVLNAIAAMEEGGNLTIKASDHDKEIVVTVADTGEGIPEENMDKIFDPFFTSKREGTGLGLSLVHKIIDGYNGKIEVSSKINEGSKFTVRIPKQMRKTYG